MRFLDKGSLVKVLLYKISCYCHTVRYLKPSQIFWRLLYKIYPVKPDLKPCPELRQMLGHWVLPIKSHKSLMIDGSFKFLNKRERLETIGWDGPACEKLWRYNQHYFDYLGARDASGWLNLHIDLMCDWVANNRPGQGTGWEPYPTSLRIVNWIKWSLSDNAMPEECLQSLAVQARWLNRKIEWHILGNHVFANAKALIFAGLFFDGKEAETWLNRGLNILSREMDEQILQDGGHFELSPMYHSIVLTDVLDLINLLQAFPHLAGKVHLRQLQTLAVDMLQWLDTMCHPDGEIAFFNDAAFNVAPTPTAIRSYARSLGIDPRFSSVIQKPPLFKHCPDSGYAALEVNHAKLLVDVASIGPDYLPGHGHADTLSFELSLFGKRTIVNRGTSQYGNGEWRQVERGTAAHNTVVVNKENSSEVWSGFRVARRARPLGLVIDKNEDSITVSCSHDGYKRLSGCPVHWRSWTLADGTFLIKDKVEGAFKIATAYFHFHPDIEIVCAGEDSWMLNVPECNESVLLIVLKGLPNIVASVFSPEFGVQLPTKCLEIQFDRTSEIAVEISWIAND
ncbi:heparinase II/III family protein [Alphaproteobacteria bacterium]|nr:heparinase II/III family protein [Alphaproteobacteria bacterium]